VVRAGSPVLVCDRCVRHHDLGAALPSPRPLDPPSPVLPRTYRDATSTC
jgi:hypothetical protein